MGSSIFSQPYGSSVKQQPDNNNEALVYSMSLQNILILDGKKEKNIVAEVVYNIVLLLISRDLMEP